MPSYKDAFHRLRQQLSAIYDTGEATAITKEVLLDVTGINYSQGLLQQAALEQETASVIEKMSAELRTGKPLQYVLGYAWFMNRKFRVDEHTLIPRPETEELADWIIHDYKTDPGPVSVLDIGTGSGCIPITLRLALPHATVSSCDISPGALAIAASNASALGAAVQFIQSDFLEDHAQLGVYDIIVSNPPYIPSGERADMHSNVKDFEPATALFVPDHDPQLFYRAIAAFGQTHLAAGGSIYCELHKDYAEDSRDLFARAGYTVALRKDINGHWRMLKAVRNPT